MHEIIKQQIYPYLPYCIVNEMDKYDLNYLTEIRIRNSKRVILRFVNNEIILNTIVTSIDMENLIEKLSNYSVYSIQRV